jgi:RNA-directed DNA polymerase
MKAPEYSDLLDYHTLLLAFLKVKANKGIAGSDNISIEKFENNLELGLLLLLNELKDGTFCSSPFHRVTMKNKGKKR